MDVQAPGRSVGDRRGDSDRREAKRSHPETRRSPNDRRQQPRHQVPFGAWAVSGFIRCRDGTSWSVILWDISRRGACVVVIGEPGLQSGETALLTLHDILHPESLVLEVELCWQFRQASQTFLGLELSGGAELPDDCFLAPYFAKNWAEDGPCDAVLL
jgi:hypothetical protein